MPCSGLDPPDRKQAGPEPSPPHTHARLSKTEPRHIDRNRQDPPTPAHGDKDKSAQTRTDHANRQHTPPKTVTSAPRRDHARPPPTHQLQRRTPVVPDHPRSTREARGWSGTMSRRQNERERARKSHRYKERTIARGRRLLPLLLPPNGSTNGRRPRTHITRSLPPLPDAPRSTNTCQHSTRSAVAISRATNGTLSHYVVPKAIDGGARSAISRTAASRSSFFAGTAYAHRR